MVIVSDHVEVGWPALQTSVQCPGHASNAYRDEVGENGLRDGQGVVKSPRNQACLEGES
jgi:hypothetical protein